MSENVNAEVNFSIQNIYVKDFSYESPNTPAIFTVQWNPKLEFDIQMDRTELESGIYDVSLHVTVTVSIADEKDESKKTVAFLVEIKQAGVFTLEGVKDKAQVDYILSTAAPEILYPYAREAISSSVIKGGFPQLLLPPMNFEAMYHEHMAQEQQKEAVVN